MLMSRIVFLITFVLAFQAHAQQAPLGQFEGMMANSGAALSQSKAASYYNPSLLRQRTQNAFSINGTSISSLRSSGATGDMASTLNIAPSYLSTVVVGDSLVHELFMANTIQGQFDIKMRNSTVGVFEASANMNRFISGYSMAFRSVPLALQVLARYSEIKMIGFVENPTGESNPWFARMENSYKNLNLALGISTHIKFNSYTLGMNFNTRGWSIFNDRVGQGKIYQTNTPNPGDLSITDVETNSFLTNEEGKLVVGHGFEVGKHEFLTDSVFMEESGNLDRYVFTQTFGYRFGDKEGDQLLCGFSHRFSSDVEYLGQNFTTSVGYSWVTRKLRSSIGVYYSQQNAQSTASYAGIMFASEFEY